MSFWRQGSTVVAFLASAAAASGAYFWYTQFRRRQDEQNAENLRSRRHRKVQALREKLERLLLSLEQIEPEIPIDDDDECIVCNTAKAVIQTFPCKHKVLCRRCFIKTLQVAVNEFNLPLKCVMCRTRIATLDRERHEGHTGEELENLELKST